MQEYTVLVFLTRKSTLTFEEFRDHWENKHLPLIEEITGPLFPKQFASRYLTRAKRKGFGGPSNRDHPLMVLRGSLGEFDFDVVAEVTCENEQAFQDFYKSIYATHAAARLAEDEDKFLEPGTMKVVVVGEKSLYPKK